MGKSVTCCFRTSSVFVAGTSFKRILAHWACEIRTKCWRVRKDFKRWNSTIARPPPSLFSACQGRHLTHVCDRWSKNRTSAIQLAFFNGDGYESWDCRECVKCKQVGTCLALGCQSPIMTSQIQWTDERWFHLIPMDTADLLFPRDRKTSGAFSTNSLHEILSCCAVLPRYSAGPAGRISLTTLRHGIGRTMKLNDLEIQTK